MSAQANGTDGCPVGDWNPGITLIAFENRMKIESEPTSGRNFVGLCSTFSTSKSRMPSPIGFVSSISITCCVAPGRSARIRGLSHRKNSDAIRQTSRDAATKFGIGKFGLSGCTWIAARSFNASAPKYLFSSAVNQLMCSMPLLIPQKDVLKCCRDRARPQRQKSYQAGQNWHSEVLHHNT